MISFSSGFTAASQLRGGCNETPEEVHPATLDSDTRSSQCLIGRSLQTLLIINNEIVRQHSGNGTRWLD